MKEKSQLHITQHIRFGLRPCPSGHCFQQRRICWKRYTKDCAMKGDGEYGEQRKSKRIHAKGN